MKRRNSQGFHGARFSLASLRSALVWRRPECLDALRIEQKRCGNRSECSRSVRRAMYGHPADEGSLNLSNWKTEILVCGFDMWNYGCLGSR